MDREDKDSIQNDYIDKLLQKIYGYTDEQILKDFEEAEKDDDSYPDFQVYPDEFDRIWEDIQAERAARTENKPEKEEEEETAATVVELPRKARKIRWKRVAIAGVAACLVTLSVCFVAVGKKSYFYRGYERSGIKGDIVFNNDDNLREINSEEIAYETIQTELNIKPLKLGYIPYEMKYLDLKIGNGNATLEFEYNDQIVYLLYMKQTKGSSVNYKSDGKEYKKVNNKWIGKEFLVRKEDTSEETTKYEAQLTDNGVTYIVIGAIDETEFTKILERLYY